MLWNGLVELLAAPPSVEIFLVEGVSNGVTSVSCHNAACRLVIGELVASQAFKVKFRGNNLPRTTHPAVDGCEFNAETTSPPDGWRHFFCNALPQEHTKLRFARHRMSRAERRFFSKALTGLQRLRVMVQL